MNLCLLLNRIVSNPIEKVALLVNEVGAVHIDEALIERSDEEVIELTNGCICCSIRGDLREALLRIAKKRRHGEMIFDRDCRNDRHRRSWTDFTDVLF
ncbi:GTP-binding protein [Exiguobacterium antarcticum]|uniref:GTP-binding protein n=1 Tax=Exiguobacterium antarcticum TaxID=132920 RepID=UPI0002FD020C|nr:GTP-binding protein [Exiguobacterium antarcticum]